MREGGEDKSEKTRLVIHQDASIGGHLHADRVSNFDQIFAGCPPTL